MRFLVFNAAGQEPEVLETPMIFEGAQAIVRGSDVFIRTMNQVKQGTREITEAHFHKAIVWKITPDSKDNPDGT